MRHGRVIVLPFVIASVLTSCAAGASPAGGRAIPQAAPGMPVHTGMRTVSSRLPPVMPVISRGLPVFSSPNVQSDSPPAHANDDDYGTQYRSTGVPAWIAYDLSSIPASHRYRVLIVYYNYSYGYSTLNGPHYNNPGSYSIQGNSARVARTPPVGGWVTLLSVQGNRLHSRQHIVNLRGYRWVRFYVTQSDGTDQNFDVAFNQLDVYDLSAVRNPTDDWIFFGDSLTAGSMVTEPGAGVQPFATLVHQVEPRRWPVAENAGEPFTTSADALTRLLGPFSEERATGYLSIFPGRYVVLAYGMGDAGAGACEGAHPGSQYKRNMAALVRATLATGKIPVVPTIGATNRSEYNACVPILNAKIEQLYRAYPRIVRGPDFWTFLRHNPQLVGANDIHPSEEGYAAMRKLWAQTMLAEVYRAGGSSAPR